MFEHKHAFTRFFVYGWLLCAPTLLIPSMWGIFIGLVLVVLTKAVEREIRSKP